MVRRRLMYTSHRPAVKEATMSLRFRIQIAFASVIVLLVAGTAMPAQATHPNDDGLSPALCGPNDIPEPGIQGEVPAGQTANYNCGLTLLGQLPRVGALQGAGQCAYVRSGSSIYVIDVSDPANPVEIGSVPTFGGSETMRAVVTPERAVLVSGRAVYDISTCASPVLKGQINWPNLQIVGIPFNLLPHDLRVNRAGTKVYGSFGLWEADITNLADPATWKITNHSCELAAQVHGPWQIPHLMSLNANLSVCASLIPNAQGITTFSSSGLQASLLWPALSHSPDVNADDTRVYVGDQAGGTSANWAPVPQVKIIDLTQSPPQILDSVDGSGHGLDWFRTANGREFVLTSNEGGSAGIPGQAAGGDTCQPHPRPFSLGWGFEVFVSEVTHDRGKNRSMLKLAINEPQFCAVRQASGRDPSVAHHMVDNPLNAKFAAVSFGVAGLRIFDIRNPRQGTPREVAYFNQGPLVHAGVTHYDASRGLIYAPTSTGFKVLAIQPQVAAHLGL